MNTHVLHPVDLEHCPSCLTDVTTTEDVARAVEQLSHHTFFDTPRHRERSRAQVASQMPSRCLYDNGLDYAAACISPQRLGAIYKKSMFNLEEDHPVGYSFLVAFGFPKPFSR